MLPQTSGRPTNQRGRKVRDCSILFCKAQQVASSCWKYRWRPGHRSAIHFRWMRLQNSRPTGTGRLVDDQRPTGPGQVIVRQGVGVPVDPASLEFARDPCPQANLSGFAQRESPRDPFAGPGVAGGCAGGPRTRFWHGVKSPLAGPTMEWLASHPVAGRCTGSVPCVRSGALWRCGSGWKPYAAGRGWSQVPGPDRDIPEPVTGRRTRDAYSGE